jgi:hypothetical protein
VRRVPRAAAQRGKVAYRPNETNRQRRGVRAQPRELLVQV